MTISPLDRRNMAGAKALILQHEPYCVSLAEQVREGGEGLFVLEAGGKVLGVLRAGMTLLHCIPRLTDDMRRPLVQFLDKRRQNGHLVHCINGEACAGAFLVSVLASLGQKMQQTNSYLLLHIDEQNASVQAAPLLQGLSIVRPKGTAAEADSLMPLQAAYAKEEVIPDCRPFSPAAIRHSLEGALRQGRVAAVADKDGTPVAKAALNAAGFGYVQIGGVYTAPAWRRQGLAKALVGNVTRAMLQGGRRIVLYVREENAAALRLYQTLGYKPLGKFSIVYY